MYIILQVAFFVLLGLSILNVIKAPTNFLWKLSVLSTEWGHVLLFPTIFIGFLLSKYSDSSLYVATSFGISMFFLIPAINSIVLIKDFKINLRRSFGETHFSEKVFYWDRLFKVYLGNSVKITTLTYCETSKLTLDVYRSASVGGDKLQPCVVIIHGGGWDSGGKRQLSPLNKYLASKGYTVVAIQYRLAPENTFPAQIDDVNVALDFLIANALLLNIDAKSFFLLGRSAGGQIAQVAAYQKNRPEIKGVIAFYSPADLVWGYTIPTSMWVMDSNKLLSNYLGGSYDEAIENYEKATVSNLVKLGLPPMLMLHGRADVLVAYEHNTRLIPYLQKANIPYYLLELPWAVHGFDFNFNGFGGQISTYAVEYFLKRYSNV